MGTLNIFGFSVTMLNNFGKAGLNYTNLAQVVVCSILTKFILTGPCTADVKNVIVLAQGTDLDP
jgi:hypothetical protein